MLLLVGEAGLGKTSLIDRACAQAARAGLDVARAAATRWKPGCRSGWPGRRSTVCAEVNFCTRTRAGRVATGRPGSFGVLRWLRTRGGGPLLLALDDLHWADPDSLALLAFLARRASSVPLGLVATLRPWATTG